MAEKLGKTIDEVEAMPNAHFVLWTRYYAREGQRRQVGLA